MDSEKMDVFFNFSLISFQVRNQRTNNKQTLSPKSSFGKF